jgi:hypothetical protein
MSRRNAPPREESGGKDVQDEFGNEKAVGSQTTAF